MIMGNHDVPSDGLYRMTDAAFSDARAVADQGDEDTFFKRFRTFRQLASLSGFLGVYGSAEKVGQTFCSKTFGSPVLV